MVAITGACPPYFVAHHRNNVTLSGAFFHLRISDQHLNASPHFALRSNSTAPVLLKGVRRRAGLRLDVQAVNEGCERTYVMVKPDGVQRGLVGEIITKFEKKGFLLRGLKLLQCPEDLAKAHYTELKEKPFYTNLVNYIISGPVVGMVWEGPGVVAAARKLIGSTNPLQAEPGTIRGDLAIEVGRNVVHGSDSPINGEREIALWFNEGELIEWDQTMAPWLRE